MHVTDARWSHEQTRFFIKQLTTSADAVAIPEPATLALLTVGAVLLKPLRKHREKHTLTDRS